MSNATIVTRAIRAVTRGRRDASATDDAYADLAKVYATDRRRLIRSRLYLTSFVYLLAIGVTVIGEQVAYPNRAWPSMLTYIAMVAICVLGIAASESARLERWTPLIAAAVIALEMLTLTCYWYVVGSVVERAAMAHLCIAAMTVVLLPWGWPPQLVVALTSMTLVSVSAPYLVGHESIAYSIIAVVIGSTTSVCAAAFLERYRWDAFLRTGLLKREAEIAAALVDVGETLSANLNEPCLLQRVNDLAVHILACDWSAVFRRHAESGVFRLHAITGMRAEIVAEAAEIAFPGEAFPLLQSMLPGTFAESPDSATSTLVPAALNERWGVSSALYVPITCGDEMMGLLTFGYHHRKGAFSVKQRRIAMGIAQATASALQNAALIHDLTAANRLKSEFVATMSRELRTPLNVISGYADLLNEGTFDTLTAPQQDTIGRIRRSALELLDLVSATLDVSRLEAGREHVERTSFGLPALCADLAREVEPLVADGVSLEWHLERASGEVVNDRIKLKTVLKNLIGNALKFTSAGAVHVTAAVAESELTIEVRDTGLGIADDDLPVIFEMFRQVDGSETRRFGGVGLGLHIVRRLTTILGGSLSVTSTAGVGSTFTVTFPLPTRDAVAHTIAA